jgi:hypothetical protein
MYYGFALKNLYDLEAISDRNPPTKAQLKAVQQIKMLWTEMLEVYKKIPYDAHRTRNSWNRFEHIGSCRSRFKIVRENPRDF